MARHFSSLREREFAESKQVLREKAKQLRQEGKGKRSQKSRKATNDKIFLAPPREEIGESSMQARTRHASHPDTKDTVNASEAAISKPRSEKLVYMENFLQARKRSLKCVKIALTLDVLLILPPSRIKFKHHNRYLLLSIQPCSISATAKFTNRKKFCISSLSFFQRQIL